MKNNKKKSPWQRFSDWVNGEDFVEKESPLRTLGELPEAEYKEKEVRKKNTLSHLSQQMIAYGVTAVVISVVMAFVLLCTVSQLPAFGSADTLTLNEVSDRYLEKGLEETGAVNAVAGMILDYRAFDTFGESTVLFAATMSVIFLTRSKHGKELTHKGPFAGSNPDPIFQIMGKILLPFIMLFGIYVVLNGHLSPGGGFSGGAILGGGLILASSVFGQDIMSEKVNSTLTTGLSVGSLMVYAVLKSYSFYTGANHVGWEIPKGTPGNILSSGFILPLNICVGIIVACTMYTFFSLFSQAEED